LEIRSSADVHRARREVRRLGLLAGLNPIAAEEAVLIAAELGTNLVRYARDGRLLVSVIETEEGRALQIESRDEGPGISDIDQALEEGFSTSGSLGRGLGSVRRLADSFEIESSSAGTRITVRKWQRK
jgi:serine/threonine-protein kinase RsbT